MLVLKQLLTFFKGAVSPRGGVGGKIRTLKHWIISRLFHPCAIAAGQPFRLSVSMANLAPCSAMGKDTRVIEVRIIWIKWILIIQI